MQWLLYEYIPALGFVAGFRSRKPVMTGSYVCDRTPSPHGLDDQLACGRDVNSRLISSESHCAFGPRNCGCLSSSKTSSSLNSYVYMQTLIKLMH